MYKPHLERKYLGKYSIEERIQKKKRTKPITQDDINKSIEAYLKAGNKIQILDPTIDCFGDEPVDNWKYNDTKKRYEN
tara:strand:+ start:749 stop:982 length:234 start_codon:yes stop_codon:yes gene_type:complete